LRRRTTENTLAYNHSHDFAAGGSSNQGNDLTRIYEAVYDMGMAPDPLEPEPEAVPQTAVAAPPAAPPAASPAAPQSDVNWGYTPAQSHAELAAAQRQTIPPRSASPSARGQAAPGAGYDEPQRHIAVATALGLGEGLLNAGRSIIDCFGGVA
jgi:hypothetical protein